MKFLLMVTLLASAAFSMTDVAVPHVFVDSGVIYASQFNNNNDTLEKRINANKDTVEYKFVRFSDLNGGDSTLTRLETDTIRSNPDIDSIRGLNIMRGNPDIDSISGNPFVTGDITISDSLKVTNGVSIGGDLYVTDSLFAARIKASGDINVGDSLRVTNGVSIGGTSRISTVIVKDTLTLSATAGGGSGDGSSAGGYVSLNGNLGATLQLFSNGTGTAPLKGTTKILYRDSAAAATYYSALEIKDTSGGAFGELKLMKSGGKVGIKTGATELTSELQVVGRIGGDSLRLNNYAAVDSLFSTKAVRSADGWFTDDVFVTDSIAAAAIKATGDINAGDSLYVTNGAKVNSDLTVTDDIFADSIFGRTVRTSAALIAAGTATVDSGFATKAFRSADIISTDDITAGDSLRVVGGASIGGTTRTATIIVNDTMVLSRTAGGGSGDGSAAGGYISLNGNLGGTLQLFSNGTGTAPKKGTTKILYRDTAAAATYYSALEIKDTSGGAFGELKLMKSGGRVGIKTGATALTSELQVVGRIGGDSLRLNNYSSMDSIYSLKAKAGRVRTDSLTFGDSWLKKYKIASSATCTLQAEAAGTVNEAFTITYTIHGDMVTLHLPTVLFSANNSSMTLTMLNAPAEIRPTTARYAIIPVVNNNTSQAGMIKMENDGTWTLYSTPSTAASGNWESGLTPDLGVNSTDMTYKLD